MLFRSVWGVVQPIVEGIGKAISEVAGWFGAVADAINGSGASGSGVGTNAEGDNNWKGGLTWVGEKGPELVELPKGSRILPNKESMSFAGGLPSAAGEVRGSVTNVVQNTVFGTRRSSSEGSEPLYSIMDILKEILELLRNRRDGKPEPDNGDAKKAKLSRGAQVIIQKLADQIIVRDEEDIDDVADRVAKKVLEVVLNMG